jgi:hypothetical protein
LAALGRFRVRGADLGGWRPPSPPTLALSILSILSIPSLPGLTRQSIPFHKKMDARVKPGHDEL